MKLSDEQRTIIDSPLESFVTQACAGSGKTRTAVNRVMKMRELIGSQRTHVLLLSFSNVAVRTFRKAFSDSNAIGANARVAIETFDSFLTSNVIRPHAYRVMECEKTPFLITGNEPFLQNKKFTFWSVNQPHNIPVKGSDINNISVELVSNELNLYYHINNQKYEINNWKQAVRNIGKTGAYTHELGRFWAYMTLIKETDVLRVLAKRYQYIVVDEAQDLGLLHCLILRLLIQAGVTVSLVGDPSQAIYEFTGADGEFMKTFAKDNQATPYPLSCNYRSVKELVDIASNISGQKVDADKGLAREGMGGFFAVYDSNKRDELVDFFAQRVDELGLDRDKSAVLCRGLAGIQKLTVAPNKLGSGKAQLFAKAAVARDANQDYFQSYELVSQSVISLLTNAPESLLSDLKNIGDNPELKTLRRLLWRFVKDDQLGLPHASLKGKTEWHEKLKENVVTLFESIHDIYQYEVTTSLGNNLTKKGFDDVPLIPQQGILGAKNTNIRVDTVHQAKGESLEATLYMADKAHITELLDGVDTEVGRIGYVALTRAESFFVIGVPNTAIDALKTRLEAIGLKELQ